jgi:hypothetical protein
LGRGDEDQFSVRPASDLGGLDDEPVAPTALVVTTAWLRSLSDDVIAALAGAVLGPMPSPGGSRSATSGVRSGRAPGPILHDPADLLLRVSAAPPTRAVSAVAEHHFAALHAEVVATGATTSGTYAGFAARPAVTLRTPFARQRLTFAVR